MQHTENASEQTCKLMKFEPLMYFESHPLLSICFLDAEASALWMPNVENGEYNGKQLATDMVAASDIAYSIYGG